MSMDLSFIYQPPEPPDWLVKDIFAKDQLIVLAGEAGVGKSILSYNLAVCVAMGLPFLGYPTARGPVLYFDEENALPDLKTYLIWTCNGLGRPDLKQLQTNLWIEHFVLMVQGPNRYKYMAQTVAKVQPVLVIIDTATPACGIRDENDNSQASEAIQGLRKVQGVSHNKTTILILKHEKFTHDKSLERTIRGAKTWIGSTDSTIFHIGEPGSKRRKDGMRSTRLVPGKRRAFGLQNELKIAPRWIERGASLKLECFPIVEP